MKLCRFELSSQPGVVRSGIVYGGKVYETDGAQPIAVYDWSQARLLSPVGNPPSVRLFNLGSAGAFSGGELHLPFSYLNPASSIPPFGTVPTAFSGKMRAWPCLAFVIASEAHRADVLAAAEVPLGLALGLALQHEDPSGQGFPSGRTMDAGYSVGPVLTTLDELEETIVTDLEGPMYKLTILTRVNGQLAAEWVTDALPATVAQMASYASHSAKLLPGELFLATMGPIDASVEHGDEIQVACDRLGALHIAIQ
ncbi:MAG: fumarylacetoacetate hydrolase family protein [Fimbriimonadales bacterium]|nr:fumarylacetoacetate hydrolase family protein [Fimbriimonadales bacterium]